MRRIVAIVMLTAIVLDCAPTLQQMDFSQIDREEPIVVSERVGDVINAEEREQFGLFPGVEGFQEARLYHSGHGGYVLYLVTDPNVLISVNGDPNAVLLLRDYIDNYENFQDSPELYRIKWEILDYDDLGIPITKYEADHLPKLSRAAWCGLGGCVAAGLGLGVLGVIELSNLPVSGAEMGAGIIVLIGAIGLAVVGGLLVGGLTGVSVYRRDKKNPLERIKEMRKPQVLHRDKDTDF